MDFWRAGSHRRRGFVVDDEKENNLTKMSQNFNTSYNITLPADGTPVKQPASFNYFVCRKADSDFEMSFNGQDWFPMAQGEGFGPMGLLETTLYFRTIDGYEQTIQIRCSTMMNVNNRLNIIHDENQILSVGTKLPATYLVPSNYVIPANGTQNIVGVNQGNQRKQIIVKNLDLNNAVGVGKAGIVGDAIEPRDDWTLETSDTVQIINQSNAPISVAVLEVYYKS
jgi:hypothetical protein